MKMKMGNILKILAAVTLFMISAGSSFAQYFGTPPSSSSNSSSKVLTSTSQSVSDNSSNKELQKQSSQDKSEKYSVVDTSLEKEEAEIEKQPVSSPFDYAYGKQQPKKQQQPQAQYRRYSTVGGVTVETSEENPEDELIMLYMKNFSIYRSPSGRIRCSARFAVLTTLPVRLSNISYRLKWPKMETTLSFNDVDPGVENHFDYALLGDGCYSMDKQPNIVVNRCRAKGMTQRQCASKIRWIKEI